MWKIYFLIFSILSFSKLQAQEIFFSEGKNLTTYNFTATSKDKINIKQGIGTNYELGYKSSNLAITPFFYTLSLSYTELNAFGNLPGVDMEWKTNHLGLKSAFFCDLFKTKRSQLALKAGAVLSTMVHGEQRINLDQFDILRNREFSGLNMGMGTGLFYNYKINSDFNFNLQYYYESLFNLSNSTKEKVGFNSSSLNLGFSVKIR